MEGSLGTNEESDRLADDTAKRKLAADSGSECADSGEESKKLKKELNLLHAVGIATGQAIGSGIFITPTIVLRYTGSFGLALICWTVGGIIAIGGGLSYAELGTLLKTSGGEYSMLREGYSFWKKHPAERLTGDLLGFLAVWCLILLEKPGAVAVMALTAGKYLSQALAGGEPPPDISTRLLAISFICEERERERERERETLNTIISLFIVLVSVINSFSLKATAVMIAAFSFTKVLVLLLISALGIWQLVVGGTITYRNEIKCTKVPGTLAHALTCMQMST